MTSRSGPICPTTPSSHRPGPSASPSPPGWPVARTARCPSGPRPGSASGTWCRTRR